MADDPIILEPHARARVEIPLEALARESPPFLNVDPEQADRIAELALRLAQEGARRQGDLTADFRPYRDRDPKQRAAMRAGVLRTIQALIMLGWIEPPA